MIEVQIDDDTVAAAKKLEAEMPQLRNSIRNNAGMLVGFVGELIVANYLDVQLQNTYDYDLVYKGVKFDVKTKEVGKAPGSNSTPKPYYECSVSAYNATQGCDVYAFTRVDMKNRVGWILGWMDAERYFKRATFRRKGELDRSNNKTFDCDCYQLEIGKLFPLDSVKKHFS